MTRFSDSVDLLSKETVLSLKQKILLVGAGGIGCEVLKNLVLSGFENIEIIDLDTIDLSNLNRQFLFQKQHIKQPKAIVARESALKFNPKVNIKAHHNSIFEPQFDLDWFKGFQLVLNALDNIAARRHVNQMCLAADIPLIESGTAGYLGQVTIHKRGEFSCYDCTPKPVEKKTYPVCTIRSTPSEPIHTIVWAKSYLFANLFGKSEDDDIHEDDDREEIERLKEEQKDLKKLRDAVGTPELPQLVFDKIFTKDIKRLLSMEEMWKQRQKPTALEYKDILEASKSTVLEDEKSLTFDQHTWSLEQSFLVFQSSLLKLGDQFVERIQRDPEDFMSFDKDDEDALNFVTSASNIRAHVFSIGLQSRFQVKQMAGNIIPAIATTNAIVAGMIVMLAIKVLGNHMDKCQCTFLSYGGGRAHLLQSDPPSKPNPQCSVCTNAYYTLDASNTFMLQDILDKVVKELDLEGEITIQSGSKLLYDVEFEDNLKKLLKDLMDGQTITITNDHDDDPEQNHSVVITVRFGKKYHLSGSKPLPVRPKMIAEPEQKKLKITEIDDDIL
ncbi:hypothetical protein EDD86DRAFT_202483, partial [Gorgonomyces haynaldii]